MTKKSKLYLAGAVFLILAILGIIVYSVCVHPAAQAQETVAAPAPSALVIYEDREVEKEVFVTEEKKVEISVVEEGIRQMGNLETADYFFTQVENYSKTTQWFVVHSTSTMLLSYSGNVTAGIDFSEIELGKDDEQKTIEVLVPEAEIQHVDIDPTSFTLYDENEKLFCELNVEDYNRALVDLEQGARDRALEMGLLTEAQENAELLLRGFIAGFGDFSDYTIRFTVK